MPYAAPCATPYAAPRGTTAPTATPIDGPQLGPLVELTLVGTGHVFDIGDPVRRIIADRRPDVVCVELDPVRLQGLRERERLTKLETTNPAAAAKARAQHEEQMRKLPLAYRWLAKMQERIADDQGVQPGIEMLAAVNEAESRHTTVGCIDVDAQRLLARAWKAMRFTERTRFLFGLMFQGRGRRSKDGVEDEIEAYEADPIAYLAKFADKFPNLKRVLIDDRDAHMAKQIIALAQQANQWHIAQANAKRIAQATSAPHPDDTHTDETIQAPTQHDPTSQPLDPSGLLTGSRPIRVVAFVGDGHVEGMLGHLRAAGIGPDSLEVIRVRDLRGDKVPANPFPDPAQATTADPNHVGFGFDVTLG